MAPIGLEVAGRKPLALLIAMIDPGPGGNEANEYGALCVANELWPGNWKPGVSSAARPATDCEESASIACILPSLLVSRCVTRATWPPAPGTSVVVCWIWIPDACSPGQVVVVGGNVAGGSQIIGMSVSSIVTVSWLALNVAAYVSGWNPAVLVRFLIAPGV